MAYTFEQGKDAVAALVKHFALNRETYRDNKEAHARQGLIDPFFAALGWDVHNTQRLAAPRHQRQRIPLARQPLGQSRAQPGRSTDDHGPARGL